MEPNEIALSAQLTRNADRLKFNLDKMRQSLRVFRESLQDIHTTECWKVRGQPYTSFSDFCFKELHLSNSRASQIMSANETLKMLGDIASPEEIEKVKNLSEGAIHVLGKVEPKKALNAFKSVAKTGKVTAKKLAIKLRIEKPTTPSPASKCPHCGKSLLKPQSTDTSDELPE